ncbi:BnaA02g25270D [Brassica napus]|uniref:BnaA02g25270D protein n=1 Tax=Brassica napus TaxID=3708 RepID=A0A078GUY3_BRANA|nr:BnaA02g25270D [Brassica napus]
MDPFNPYRAVGNKVKECIDKYLMSKEETERYLEDQQGITRQDTNMAWIILERMHPDLFTSYYARIHERNARTRERVSSTSPRERASAILGGQEQQRLSPARRSLLPDSNVPDASPQEANAVYPTSQAGTSIASNALGHIIKLLSDGHGLGPHPSATGSLKRKQVGENERDGNNEEAEKQIMEKEECNDEEAEKPKEKEEGSDEKLQKNEEGDNEGLQKKNEGDNEELQEAA